MTALHWAVYNGQLGVAKALIELGARADTLDVRLKQHFFSLAQSLYNSLLSKHPYILPRGKTD